MTEIVLVDVDEWSRPAATLRALRLHLDTLREMRDQHPPREDGERYCHVFAQALAADLLRLRRHVGWSIVLGGGIRGPHSWLECEGIAVDPSSHDSIAIMSCERYERVVLGGCIARVEWTLLGVASHANALEGLASGSPATVPDV